MLHFNTLQVLISMLIVISSSGQGLDIHTIAKLFGPILGKRKETLFVKTVDLQAMHKDHKILTQLLELLITEATHFFEGIDGILTHKNSMMEEVPLDIHFDSFVNQQQVSIYR